VLSAKGASTKVRGLSAVPLQATGDLPVSAAYRAGLAARGLPGTLTLDQIKGQLAVLGFNPEALVTAVTSADGAQAGASVRAGLSQPLPLAYSIRIDKGESAVEPDTGAVLETHAATTISTRIDPDALHAARDALTPLAGIPLVKRTMDVLDLVAVAPAQPVFTTRIDSTPASVAAAVKDARHYRTVLRVVRIWVPIGLVAIAALFASLGLMTRRLRREELDLRTKRGITIDARDATVPAAAATEEADELQHT